ncbi:hypothetical protein QOT17_000681 [Balamuthia mandrillaris]
MQQNKTGSQVRCCTPSLFQCLPLELQATVVSYLSFDALHALRLVCTTCKELVDRFGGCLFCRQGRRVHVYFKIEGTPDHQEAGWLLEPVFWRHVDLYPIAKQGNASRAVEEEAEEKEGNKEEEKEQGLTIDNADYELEVYLLHLREERRNKRKAVSSASFLADAYGRKEPTAKSVHVEMDGEAARQLFCEASSLLQALEKEQAMNGTTRDDEAEMEAKGDIKTPPPEEQMLVTKVGRRTTFMTCCDAVHVSLSKSTLVEQTLIVSGTNATVRFLIPITGLHGEPVEDHVPVMPAVERFRQFLSEFQPLANIRFMHI